MRVDFYEMSGRFSDPLRVAAVLVRLDALLWQEPDGRFLPHGIDDAAAPIRLLETPPANAPLLINLDPAAALPEGRYDRVLEIVPPDETLRQHLRRRWSAWKERGAELHHHVLK